jgi:hypothetical protein
VAITYPLTPPSSPTYSRARLTGVPVVGVSKSPFSGSQQVYQHPGQWWEAELALPPMVRADAEEWISFLLKLNGIYGTFFLGDPLGATARGIATGTPLVDGGSQTGNSLDTKGWTAGQTGILKAGDYIQLGGGASTRLYKVLADADSDGGGLSTLTIWPNLRTSPLDSDTVTVSSCVGTFRLASNETLWDMDEARHYGISFGAVEAI